ncbi:hypothetical protein DFH08DRAFT_38802 [Mycena albidolilacea]|uniref:Protein kinase domain-containing protein n=1 Tax=Mycena albidolilacea TaxID=1033008 RepID=A0AAD7AW02_9AGAR|nr:hypothetical protein DFH08DRAFT_38802 [Mycena albidolilacea]
MSTDAQSAPYPGAFFPGASGFLISGGVFTSNVTNNVYNPPQEQPSAFRMILLGDIKLIKELCWDNESRVSRQTRGAGVRRMYSAKVIGGEHGPMTVSMYQGGRAEEEWRQHLAKYESIRHPNIMQLYGLVSTKGIRGLVFHDELVPYHQFFSRFQYSPILTTYIRGYCSTEFREASTYCRSVLPTCAPSFFPIWIRPTTGELCADLVSSNTEVGTSAWEHIRVSRFENLSLDSPDAEAILISNFHEGDYHELCSVPPIAKFKAFSVST